MQPRSLFASQPPSTLRTPTFIDYSNLGQSSLLTCSTLCKDRNNFRASKSSSYKPPYDMATAHSTSNQDHLVRGTIVPDDACHQLQVLLPLRSPISNTPDDILLRVFELCLGNRDVSSLSQRRRSTPWALSHVCQRWRALMLCYHQLWSFICLDAFYMPGDPASLAYARRSALHLDRSGSSTPLCINISPSVPYPRAMMDRLLRTSSRWAQLHLGDVIFKEDAHPLLKHTYQNLRRLTLPAKPAAMEVFTSTTSPRLTDVTFTQIIGLVPILPEFPYSQLTYLALGESAGDGTVLEMSPGSALHELLSCCQNLVDLRITATTIVFGKRRRRTNPDSKKKILHPDLLHLQNLTSLSLRVQDEASTFCLFLRCLRLPALQRLSIAPASNAVLKSVYRVVQRSECRILSLKLTLQSLRPRAPETERLTFISPLLSLLSHLDYIHLSIFSPATINLALRVIDVLRWGGKRAGRRSSKCPRLSRLTVRSPVDGPEHARFATVLSEILSSRSKQCQQSKLISTFANAAFGERS